MIAVIVRNGFRSLRRDRGAFLLAFILPIAFFSIFATSSPAWAAAAPRA